MNKFNRLINCVLAVSFFIHTCAPAYAIWGTIDDVEKNQNILEKGAVQGTLNFKADPKKTAAGCFFYARHKGERKIFLGLRDDENTYCNPGGKSDENDKNLYTTAGRESGEETFNIYSPHPEILKNHPFVDLYSLKENMPFLNRMYFIEQEYVDSDIFNKRLENKNLSKSQKEYRHFKWVSAKDILKAIQEKKKTFHSDGDEITLFEPLFQTLLTETSQCLLNHLVNDKMIPLFTPHKNKIHKEGFYSVDKTFSISWTENEKRVIKFSNLTLTQTPIVNELENRFMLGKAVAGKGATNLEIKKLFRIPLDPNKRRSQLNHLKIIDKKYFEKNRILFNLKDESEEISLNSFYHFPQQQLLHISPKKLPQKNIPFKGLPLKKEFKKIPIVKKLPQRNFPSKEISVKKTPQKLPMVKKLTQKFLPLKDAPLEGKSFALSDLLLQAQLGEDYVKPLNPNDPLSRHEADVQNFKLYHEKFSKVEGELKRETKPLETDYLRLADVLKLEREFKNWIPLHHASSPHIKYFWVIGTALRELLALRPVASGTNPYMRTTDIYFRGHSTMNECVQKAGTHDYEEGNASRRFCGNMAMTAGLSTTHTSSNSIEYFLNSHSVLDLNTMKRFEEATQLLGMVDTSYLPYQALYEQFYGSVSKDNENSAFTVVFVKPESLDTYAYSAHGGGSPFHVEAPERIKERHTEKNSKDVALPSALKLYEIAEKELMEKNSPQIENKKPELDKNQKIANSIAEIRLLLHPSLISDPNKVRVYSIDRFPLDKARQKKFNAQLMALNIADVGRWLGQHTKLMPDSLHSEEAAKLKNLYKFAHRGITEKDVIEELSAEAFPHLVKNGHYDGANQFFESYGNILKNLKTSPKDLALLAVNSGSAKMLSFIINSVLKTSVAKVFTENDVKFFARSYLNGSNSEAYEYIFKNYDMNSIDDKIRRQWGVDLLAKGSLERLNTFHQAIYPIDEGMLEESIHKNVLDRQYVDTSSIFEGLLKFTGLSKKSMVECFVKHLAPEFKNKPGYYHLSIFLSTFVDSGFDYKTKLFSSENPVLFYMPQFCYSESDLSNPKSLLNVLRQDCNLFAYTNKEGLNIIQFMQQQFLKGIDANIYSTFKTEILKKEMDEFEPYPAFFTAFGNLKDFCLLNDSPFKNTDFKIWREKLNLAMKKNSLSQIMTIFKEIPDYKYLNLFKMKNPSDYLYQKLQNKQCSFEKKWTPIFSKLIKEDKYNEIFSTIDEMTENDGYVIEASSLLNKEILSMNHIMKEHSKNDPIDPFIQLNSFKDFDQAFKEKKITQKILRTYAYNFFKDENESLILPILKHIFPNPSDLLKEEFKKNILSAVMFSSETKAIKMFLNHVGCFNFLSQLSEEQFEEFLFARMPIISDDLVSFVYENSPEIFSYKDKEKNFLKFFYFNEKLFNFDFIEKNLTKLKETYTSDGVPILFMIGKNIDLLKKVIDLDPSVISLKTKDGLTALDFLSILGDEDEKNTEQLKELFTPKEIRNPTNDKIQTPIKQPPFKGELIKKVVKKIPVKVNQMKLPEKKAISPKKPVKKTPPPLKQNNLF